MRCNHMPLALRRRLTMLARPRFPRGWQFSPGGSVGLAVQFIIAAMLMIGTSAQEPLKPDFSGKWVIPGSAPANAASLKKGDWQESGMGNGWSPNITIAQDGGMLTVKYDFFTRIDMQPAIKFSYALNGTKTTNSVMMGRGIQRSISTATWHGDTLVIKTEQPFRNPETGREEIFEVTRQLSLESPGQLRVETTFGGVLGGPPTVTSTKYTRGSQPP